MATPGQGNRWVVLNPVGATALFAAVVALSQQYVEPAVLQVPGRALYAPFFVVSLTLLLTTLASEAALLGAYVLTTGLLATGIGEALPRREQTPDPPGWQRGLTGVSLFLGVLLVVSGLPIRYVVGPHVPAVVGVGLLVGLAVARVRGRIDSPILAVSSTLTVLAILTTQAPTNVDQLGVAVVLGLALVVLGLGLARGRPARLLTGD